MGTHLYILKDSYLSIKNYVYFIVDENTQKTALVDPVWNIKKILTILEQKNLDLSCILITHTHPDHTQLADVLARETGCTVHMSRIEADYYGFECINLTPLQNGEEILSGETTIKPILTPGHTRGSFCYIAGNNIFTGDTLFIEGCGLCWGKGADPSEMYNSLQMLKKTIPPDMKVYPAHCYGEKPGMVFKQVLQYNIYLDFKKKEDFIKYRMRKNQKLLFSFK